MGGIRTNRARAEEFGEVLDHTGAEEPDTGLIDLLTNALHYCDQTHVDFNECLAMARFHHEAEVCEED